MRSQEVAGQKIKKYALHNHRKTPFWKSGIDTALITREVSHTGFFHSDGDQG